MTQYQLREEEAQALRVLLNAVIVDRRSNEVGIEHARRFVSSRHGVDTDALVRLARKVGAELRVV